LDCGGGVRRRTPIWTQQGHWIFFLGRWCPIIFFHHRVPAAVGDLVDTLVPDDETDGGAAGARRQAALQRALVEWRTLARPLAPGAAATGGPAPPSCHPPHYRVNCVSTTTMCRLRVGCLSSDGTEAPQCFNY